MHPFWLRVQEQAVESYTMKEVFDMDSSVRVEAIENLGRLPSLARVGSNITVPLSNRPVETWICQFIPCHVWMYAESFVLSSTCCLVRRVSRS